MGIEVLHLGGVITHLIALFFGLLSLHRYSDIWTKRQWVDVDFDYIALAGSICMNVLIIGLLVEYAFSAPSETLTAGLDILFSIYHTLTGLIVSYWHWSVREKYEARLDILGIKHD